MKKRVFYIVVVFCSGMIATTPRIKINFVPESEKFKEAVKDYERIWNSEGEKIINGLERHSGLRFTDSVITAVVYEGPSSSGFKTIKPMQLRASYPTAEIKIAALSHEMAHRLNESLHPRNYEDHPMLFLYLYDTWVDLYGKPFADSQVKIESERKGLYDYETAWKETLSMTFAQRKQKLTHIIDSLRLADSR